MKKAVVTGGAGFIGSHVVDALVDKGFSVVVIDNLSGGKKERVNENAELHVVDIRNYDAITPLIDGAEYVFHLAALPRVPYSIEHPLETHDVNVNGILNVLEASRHGGVKRFVYSASSSAYGEQETMPLREDMPAMPVNPYGLQKYIGELKCKMYSDVYNLPTVSLRYFNVFGPRLDPEGEYALVIGKFLKQRGEGIPLTIVGDGGMTRDFTHVSDVVSANMLAAESSKIEGGEVFNIGAGRRTTINELAGLFSDSTTSLPPRIEARHSQADNSRAREVLGWGPTVTLEEGIAELKKIHGIE